MGWGKKNPPQPPAPPPAPPPPEPPGQPPAENPALKAIAKRNKLASRSQTRFGGLMLSDVANTARKTLLGQ